MIGKIKIAGYLLLPYLFACSLGWDISYWSTFDINPFEYLELSDIVKSFIYPLIASSFISIIFFLIITNSIMVIFVSGLEKVHLKEHPVVRRVLYIFGLLGWLVLVVYTINQGEKINWIYFPFLYYLFAAVSLCLVDYSKLDSSLTNQKYKIPIVFSLLLIPTLCVSDAKVEAINVKQNALYDYTIVQLNDSTSINYKILGKLGDYMILSTGDNKEKQIIHLDKTDNLKIYHFNYDEYIKEKKEAEGVKK